MVKVTKKPTQIEAHQYVSHDQIALEVVEETAPAWLINAVEDGRLTLGAGSSGDKILIQSDTHGELTADPSDWIMYGVEGELYPCKDSVFQATYHLDEVVDPRDPNPELA